MDFCGFGYRRITRQVSCLSHDMEPSSQRRTAEESLQEPNRVGHNLRKPLPSKHLESDTTFHMLSPNLHERLMNHVRFLGFKCIYLLNLRSSALHERSRLSIFSVYSRHSVFHRVDVISTSPPSASVAGRSSEAADGDNGGV